MGACYSDKSPKVPPDLDSSTGGMPSPTQARGLSARSGLPRPKSGIAQPKVKTGETKPLGTAKPAGANGTKMGAAGAKPTSRFGFKKGGGSQDTRLFKSASQTLNNNSTSASDSPKCAVAKIIGDNIPMIDDDSDIINANTEGDKPRSSSDLSKASPRLQSKPTANISGASMTKGVTNGVKSAAQGRSGLKKPQTAVAKEPAKSAGRQGTKAGLEVSPRKTAAAGRQPPEAAPSPRKAPGGTQEPEIHKEKSALNHKSLRMFKGLKFGGGSKKAKPTSKEQEKDDQILDLEEAGVIPKEAPIARVDSVSLSSCNPSRCASLLPSPADEQLPLPAHGGVTVQHETKAVSSRDAHVVSTSPTESFMDASGITSSTPLSTKVQSITKGKDVNMTTGASKHQQKETKLDTTPSAKQVSDHIDSVVGGATEPLQTSVTSKLNVTFDLKSERKKSQSSVDKNASSVADTVTDSSVGTEEFSKPRSGSLTARHRSRLTSQQRLQSEDCESLGSLNSDDLMLDLEIDEFEDLPLENSSQTDGSLRPRASSQDSHDSESARSERRGPLVYSKGAMLVRRGTDGGLQKRLNKRRSSSLREQAPLAELSTLVDEQLVVRRNREKPHSARPASYPGSMITRPRSMSVDVPMATDPSMFKQRKQLSVAEDCFMMVDAVKYRQMNQEITDLKTMLYRLKRVLLEEGVSSPLTPNTTLNGLLQGKVGSQEQEAKEKTSASQDTENLEKLVKEKEEMQRQMKLLQEQVQLQQRTIHLLQEQMTKYACEENRDSDRADAAIQTELLLTSQSAASSPDQGDVNNTFTISSTTTTDEDQVTQIEVSSFDAGRAVTLELASPEAPNIPDMNDNCTHTEAAMTDSATSLDSKSSSCSSLDNGRRSKRGISMQYGYRGRTNNTPGRRGYHPGGTLIEDQETVRPSNRGYGSPRVSGRGTGKISYRGHTSPDYVMNGKSGQKGRGHSRLTQPRNYDKNDNPQSASLMNGNRETSASAVRGQPLGDSHNRGVKRRDGERVSGDMKSSHLPRSTYSRTTGLPRPTHK